MRWIALLLLIAGCAADRPKLALKAEYRPLTQEVALMATVEVP